MTSVGLFYVARKVTHFLFITSSFLNDTFCNIYFQTWHQGSTLGKFNYIKYLGSFLLSYPKKIIL